MYLAYAALWYGNADYVRSRIEELVNRAPAPVHAVIIDANAIADIDYTALQTLRGLIAELAQRKIVVGIARASHLVHHDLKHGSVLNLLGVDRLCVRRGGRRRAEPAARKAVVGAQPRAPRAI